MLAHKLPFFTQNPHGAIAFFTFLFSSFLEARLHPDNTDRKYSVLHQITEGVYCKNISVEHIKYKIVYPFVKALYFYVYITLIYIVHILNYNAVHHDWKCKQNSLGLFAFACIVSCKILKCFCSLLSQFVYKLTVSIQLPVASPLYSARIFVSFPPSWLLIIISCVYYLCLNHCG
jgi:hypothetical protein